MSYCTLVCYSQKSGWDAIGTTHFVESRVQPGETLILLPGARSNAGMVH